MRPGSEPELLEARGRVRCGVERPEGAVRREGGQDDAITGPHRDRSDRGIRHHRTQHHGRRCGDAQPLGDRRLDERTIGEHPRVPAAVEQHRDESGQVRDEGLGADEHKRTDRPEGLLLGETELAHAPGHGVVSPTLPGHARGLGEVGENAARLRHLRRSEPWLREAHEARDRCRLLKQVVVDRVEGQTHELPHRDAREPAHLGNDVDALAAREPSAELLERFGEGCRGERLHIRRREQRPELAAQGEVVGAVHVEQQARAEHGRPQVARGARPLLGEVLGVHQHAPQQCRVPDENAQARDAHNRPRDRLQRAVGHGVCRTEHPLLPHLSGCRHVLACTHDPCTRAACS